MQKIQYFPFFSDLPLKSNQVAVITGGTRGIGLEVIKMLLKCDINVVIGKKEQTPILKKNIQMFTEV